jgi:hypothetical protein
MRTTRFWVAIGAVLAGCGGDDSGAGPSNNTCQPGDSVPCVCADGMNVGTQTCLAGGAFGTCDPCGGSGGDGGGDAVTPLPEGGSDALPFDVLITDTGLTDTGGSDASPDADGGADALDAPTDTAPEGDASDATSDAPDATDAASDG